MTGQEQLTAVERAVALAIYRGGGGILTDEAFYEHLPHDELGQRVARAVTPILREATETLFRWHAEHADKLRELLPDVPRGTN